MSAHINEEPLDPCADSFISSHGSATCRSPLRGPAGAQTPALLHTKVLRSESRPKLYTG